MLPLREVASTQLASGKAVDCMSWRTKDGLSAMVLRWILLRVFDGRVDQPGVRGREDQVTEVAGGSPDWGRAVPPLAR